MELFYFLSGQDRLFGAYHPAADITSRKSVVICPPLYPEYNRTYRFLSKLAECWAAKGYHVLRFDYFGTGDSAGNPSDGGPNRWISDIDAAIAELKDVSGSRQVSVAGVRLGGTLGLRAAATQGGISSVILWDPVCSGIEYVDSLRETHRRMVESFPNLSSAEKDKAMDELIGYRTPHWVSEELSKLLLTDIEIDGLQELVAVISEPHSAHDELSVQCRSKSVQFESVSLQSAIDWQTASEDTLHAPGIFDCVESCLK